MFTLFIQRVVFYVMTITFQEYRPGVTNYDQRSHTTGTSLSCSLQS